MRKFLAPLAMAVLAGAVSAQTVNSRCINCKIEWDGSPESCWKVNNPSTASDVFSVDIDAKCAGLQVVAICAEFCDTNPAAGARPGFLSINPDNLVVDPTGTTPDKLNPCVAVVKPTGNPGTFCTDVVAYNVPDKCLGSTNLHVLQGFCPNDSSLWLCADSAGPQFGNSYFTTDCYATPAIPFTVNWVLGAGVIPKPVRFWANGGTSTTINELDNVALLFVGSCAFQPFMIFLTNCAGALITPAINLVFFTGIGAVDDAGHTACLVAAWPCEVFLGTLCFGTLYRECPPSKRIKVSNDVAITVDPTGGTPALPGVAVKFGQVVPAAQSDWSCPATLYDTPDFAPGTRDYHSAANWATGDSCLWLGGDGWGPATCTYFSYDNFAAPATQFSPENWMIRILWK